MAKRINPDANSNNALKMYTDNIKCECDPTTPSCDYLFIWAFVAGSSNSGYADPNPEIVLDLGTAEAGCELIVGFALLSGAMTVTSATPSGDFAGDWTVEQSVPYSLTPIEPPTPTAFLKLAIDANEPSGSYSSIVTFETADCGTIEVTMNYQVTAIEMGYQALIYITEVEETSPGVYDVVGSPSNILNFLQNGTGPESYPLSSPTPVSSGATLYAFLAYAMANNAIDVDMAQPDSTGASNLLPITLTSLPEPAFPVTVNSGAEQFIGAFLLDNNSPGSYTDSFIIFDINPANPLYQTTLVLPYNAAP